MTKPSLPALRKRVPNGVVSARPIALRLQPHELERVKEKADKEQRSMASVCRLAVLRDLGLIKKGSP
jgi:flagellar biosynthesis/type III secretory pathway protein FliH